MQEPIDNALGEFLTREEELCMQDKEELIKHILKLEKDLDAKIFVLKMLLSEKAEQQDTEGLPW